MIHYETGNLFDYIDRVDAIAHGCNCRGVMGAGIAKEFKARWPKMFDRYKSYCDDGTFTLGSVMPWYDYRVVIYNLGTQDLPGPHANLTAVEKSLSKALNHLESMGGVSLAIPQIGCGIGGLDWADVNNILEDLSLDTTADITVVEFASEAR